MAEELRTEGGAAIAPVEVAGGAPPEPQPGPKFFVSVEGTEHPWPRSTITTEEIANLGGWDPSVGVIEIDKDNNERTLRPGETVELKPGHGFAKRIRFKRG